MSTSTDHDAPALRATVLVVDDVEAHRYVFGTWLRRAGYAVVEAATGAEALHAVDTHTIDLVTLDVNLPDMSGMEVCERIKSAPRTAALPILHLSGTAIDVSDRNEGLRRGADAYLVEPVESDELLATINALLRYSAARRQAVRIAGHLRRLHTATLAVSGATNPEGLAAAATEGTSAVFERPAVVAMTIGTRSLVARARPGGTARLTTSAPLLPHETAATIATEGRIAAAALGVTFDLAIDSYIGALLTDRAGAVLGAVLVADQGPTTAEEDGEIRLILDQLAHAISISIENLRAYELEHRISLTLQKSLLPARAEPPSGLDIAVRYEAAASDTEVGGDFYEVIELDPGHVIVAVGDVVGHSLQAAIVMAELRNGLRAYALEGHGPTAILERLDRLLRRFHTSITATVCLGVIDIAQRQAVMANAGHISPLVLRPTGVELVEPHGPLLGMGLPTPPSIDVDLTRGATLLLVTDGLLERRHEIIDIGIARLVDTTTNWDGDLDQLCDRLLDEVGPGSGATDDIALLAVRFADATPAVLAGRPIGTRESAVSTESTGGAGEGPATQHRRTETFARDSREIARARNFVTSALASWQLDDEIAAFELMVSELVSNAIVHGDGRIGVQVSRNGQALRLEVTDEGGDARPRIHPRTIGGWGLQFVDQLADDWGTEQRGDSTLVWAVKRTATP